MTTQNENINMTKYACYLCGFSVLQNIVLHPLNVILTKKQNVYTNISFYKYTEQLIKTQNIKYLTRGMYTSICGYSFGQMIHLFGIEYLKINPYFQNENNNIIFAGAISDFFSCITHYPFSLISTMQITYKKEYNSNIFLQRLYSRGGYKSLYNGFGLYALTGSVCSGLWWFLYENFKIYSKQYTNNNILNNGLCSLSSTIVTTFLFNPFSVIVTKMQSDRNASYGKIIKNIYHKNGIKGFWTASLLNGGSYVLNDLFFSFTYEMSHKFSKI